MSEGMSRYVSLPNFKSISLKMAFLGRFIGRKWLLFVLFLRITKHFLFLLSSLLACAERRFSGHFSSSGRENNPKICVMNQNDPNHKIDFVT